MFQVVCLNLCRERLFMLNAQMEEKHLKQWNKSAPKCACSCIWSCGGHGFACGSDVNPCVVAKHWDMTYSFSCNSWWPKLWARVCLSERGIVAFYKTPPKKCKYHWSKRVYWRQITPWVTLRGFLRVWAFSHNPIFWSLWGTSVSWNLLATYGWLSWLALMVDSHGWLSWLVLMVDSHGWLSWFTCL